LTTSQRPLLFIDGSAGAAGDMLLAALFDLGVSSAAVRRSLKTLPIEGWTLRVTTVERAGLAARKIRVGVHSAQPRVADRQSPRSCAAVNSPPAFASAHRRFFNG
jgi:uncharacterized protein (DUF111 family)